MRYLYVCFAVSTVTHVVLRRPSRTLRRLGRQCASPSSWRQWDGGLAVAVTPLVLVEAVLWFVRVMSVARPRANGDPGRCQDEGK